MTSEVSISKNMSDIIVQVCFEIVEFSRLYDNHAQQLFQCNEEVKKGLKWFMNSNSQTDFHQNVSDFLKAVTVAKQMYQDIQIPIENKEKIIGQLSNLQTQLSKLGKASISQ